MKSEQTFIPLDYSFFDYQGKNYIKIIGKTKENKKICVIDTCDIYFWAILKKNISEKRILDIQKKIEKIEIESSTRLSKVIKTEIKEKRFLGRKVKAIKIYATNQKDLNDIADEIEFKEIIKKRESDVSFITRYIIEKKVKPLIWHNVKGEILNNDKRFGNIDSAIETDICIYAEEIKESKEQIKFTPKIMSYDIETDEVEIGKGEILMISIVSDNFQKVLTWKESIKKLNFVEYYKNEEDMIEAFVNHIKEQNPDILSGYFSDGFDLPYLRSRAEKNKIRLNIGIDNSQPKFSRGKFPTAKINGIIHLDVFKFIKTNYSQYLQSETLSLNEVASELLNEKKVDFNREAKSETLNNEEWETYFKYNLQDSVLTYKLSQKIWPDLMEFTKVISEPLFEVSRESMSTHVENYIIHNLSRFNEIIEKKPFDKEISKRINRERYEGAFVFQPKPGLYEDIVMFDFTSFWPSIIASFNLSRSGFLGERKPKKINKDKFLKVIVNEKTYYFSKREQFFPEMLKEIILKRKEFKKDFKEKPSPLLKARSNAFKLLANASYGYQGFFGARYYCPEASASTTAISREFIKKTIEISESKGFTPVYGDTDSLALLRNNKTKKESLELLKELNKNLPGIMELDLEDFYKRGIWVTKRTGEFGAKKKYALINEQGKLKIRGFETVRRDWCKLSRETQNKVIEYILKEGNEKKALEFIKQIIKKIKSRQVEKKDLLIKTQLKKAIRDYKSISPHVVAAKKMKERKIPISEGGLVEYYIAKTNQKKQLIRDMVRLPDEDEEYNIDYYLNHQIIPAVENIFQVFGVNLKEITEGKKQTNLGDF